LPDGGGGAQDPTGDECFMETIRDFENEIARLEQREPKTFTYTGVFDSVVQYE